MTVWEKYPTLKSILVHKAHLKECQDIFKDLNESELQEVQAYIVELAKNIEHTTWKTQNEARLIQAQKQFVIQDMERMEKIHTSSKEELIYACRLIFKNPNAAIQRIQKHEQKLGLKRTSFALANTPAKFGALKGINLLGIHLLGRKKALNVAHNLQYEALKENYRQSYKILTWLQNITNVNIGKAA